MDPTDNMKNPYECLHAAAGQATNWTIPDGDAASMHGVFVKSVNRSTHGWYGSIVSATPPHSSLGGTAAIGESYRGVCAKVLTARPRRPSRHQRSDPARSISVAIIGRVLVGLIGNRRLRSSEAEGDPAAPGFAAPAAAVWIPHSLCSLVESQAEIFCGGLKKSIRSVAVRCE